jgi:2-dehydro-3-deoxyphosphooctonate aldolase (KDO 8-P synthase)
VSVVQVPQVQVAQVKVGDVVFGGGQIVLIAGPCVIEDRDSCLRHAERLAAIARRAALPLVFKASFDKANRTSHRSFRGPGLDGGLCILAEIKRELALPLLTDVHESTQVRAVAEVVDVLQIPALLSRQTDLIQAAAATGRALNVKKGQFLAPWDMRATVQKVESSGNRRLLLTERGFSFGYNNLVADFRSLVVMRSFGYPVIFDATHSVQLPGASGEHSDGERQFVAPLARAAVAVGIDGIFMEVHEDPEHALSDGPSSFPLDELPHLLDDLKRIDELIRTHSGS